MKIKLFKTKKSFKKKDYQISPDIYWVALLCVAVIIVGIAIFHGFSMFFEINKDFNSYNITTNDQVEKSRKIRLEKALEFFTEREKKSENIINSPSPVVDPSL